MSNKRQVILEDGDGSQRVTLVDSGGDFVIDTSTRVRYYPRGEDAKDGLPVFAAVETRFVRDGAVVSR